MSAWPSIRTHVFRSTSRTSDGVLSPASKMLHSSAFGVGVEFITPPGLASDSVVGDSSCFMMFTISTVRPAVTVLRSRCSSFLSTLIVFCTFYLVETIALYRSAKQRFSSYVFQCIMKPNSFLTQSLLHVGDDLLFPWRFSCQKVMRHLVLCSCLPVIPEKCHHSVCVHLWFPQPRQVPKWLWPLQTRQIS